MNTYITTEKEIAQKSHVDIHDPVRVFNLEELGLDRESFLQEFAPDFANLSWDMYDVKVRQVHYLTNTLPEETDRLDNFLSRYFESETDLAEIQDILDRLSSEQKDEFSRIAPYRRRAVAKFTIEKKSNGSITIERKKAETFAQVGDKSDYRTLVRVFQEVDESITSGNSFKKLLNAVAGLISEVEPKFQIAEIGFHLISVITRKENVGEGAPEGIHKDGDDYIVSALVIEREHVSGAESIIYGPDKKTEYFRYTLQPGEGIFQADRKSDLWHYVTPIVPAHDEKTGKRSVLGFDINIIK